MRKQRLRRTGLAASRNAGIRTRLPPSVPRPRPKGSLCLYTKHRLHPCSVLLPRGRSQEPARPATNGVCLCARTLPPCLSRTRGMLGTSRAWRRPGQGHPPAPPPMAKIRHTPEAGPPPGWRPQNWKSCQAWLSPDTAWGSQARHCRPEPLLRNGGLPGLPGLSCRHGSPI